MINSNLMPDDLDILILEAEVMSFYPPMVIGPVYKLLEAGGKDSAKTVADGALASCMAMFAR